MTQRCSRIAIVTGATRRKGIGAAICRALAQEGTDIFFTHWHPYDQQMAWGITEEEPLALERELRQAGIRAESLSIDLSDPAAPARVLDEAEKRLGTPAILVNNAAYSLRDIHFDKLTAEILDAHYAVNMRATLLLSSLFAQRCPTGCDGRIIAMTSGQSLGPMPGELAYIATKGAIEAFIRTLAVEVASKGITVNAVNPGPTDTGWMDEVIKKELLPRFPMGREGRPEDAARLIAFLARKEAGWITGQVIHSEGGFIR
ncbi:SDR family oxidoreductase [Marinithermofilum abyssi]|nr:SDR family oxidoreductase [Marinithermofilum abyssi]